MHRKRARAIGLLAAGVAAACSTASSETTEQAGSQAQAVWNRDGTGAVVVSNDTNDPVRNVVVQIPHFLADGSEDRGDTGCTGVLVTPSLVLTSKYCVSQTKGGPSPVVQIGASRDDASFVRRASIKPSVVMPSTSFGSLDQGDLALVFLEPDTSARFGELRPQRPSIEPPNASDPNGDGRAKFSKIEMVGWSAYTFNDSDSPQTISDEYARHRQVGTSEEARLWFPQRDSVTPSPFFIRPVYEQSNPATAQVGLHAGDFGGPLYAYPSKTQPARRLVGIATLSALAFESRTPVPIAGTTCVEDQCDVWIDLTAPAVGQWIASNAADTSHDNLPNWNVSHAHAGVRTRANGVADWWYGESDANGAACDTSKDADCDGWFDKNDDGSKRDNCPDVPNPGQEDTDDDGLGDACNGCGANQGGDACDTGLNGVCAQGIRRCKDGALACVARFSPSPDICDGKDNDCDGNVDNGDPGGGGTCVTGKSGVCSGGTLHCQNGAVKCVQTTQPRAEVCDGIDNDCDGAIDDGNPGGGVACNTTFKGVCAAGTTQCAAGTTRCVQNTPASAEVCDGLDNDCDGTVDDGDPGGGVACTTGQSGACAPGTRHCRAGALACDRNTAPRAEVCNGADDDCDGQADDGNPGGGAACSTGKSGICATGVMACANGGLRCAQTVNPRTETCNGVDDDCDGAVDDGDPGGGGSCTLAGCTVAKMHCSGGSLKCGCECHAIPRATACRGLCGEVADNGCGGVWTCPKCGTCACQCCAGNKCINCP